MDTSESSESLVYSGATSWHCPFHRCESMHGFYPVLPDHTFLTLKIPHEVVFSQLYLLILTFLHLTSLVLGFKWTACAVYGRASDLGFRI